MANDRDEQDDVTPETLKDNSTLGLLERLVELQEAGPVKQIPASKAKFVTPWNPTGSKRRPTLTRKVYQNGANLRESRLTNEDILLLNQLQPGHYQNRRWTVIETDGEGQRSLFIQIPNQTQQDRIELATKAKDLTAILRMMIEEKSAVA